jgi:hypothetical protein
VSDFCPEEDKISYYWKKVRGGGTLSTHDLTFEPLLLFEDFLGKNDQLLLESFMYTSDPWMSKYFSLPLTDFINERMT